MKLSKEFYYSGTDYPEIQQFRIYDPNEKKFYYSGGTPMMIAKFFELTAPLHTYYGMSYQRMSSIKDMYEGDIILVPSGYAGDSHREEIISCIIWDNYSFDLDPFVGQDFWWDELKVIGNIYDY